MLRRYATPITWTRQGRRPDVRNRASGIHSVLWRGVSSSPLNDEAICPFVESSVSPVPPIGCPRSLPNARIVLRGKEVNLLFAQNVKGAMKQTLERRNVESKIIDGATTNAGRIGTLRLRNASRDLKQYTQVLRVANQRQQQEEQLRNNKVSPNVPQHHVAMWQQHIIVI